MIFSGFWIERLRAYKRGEYINKDFRNYCLQTRLSLEYASTNTPQQTDMSERVGRTLATMVGCMVANSGLPKIFWGELISATMFLGNRALHFVICMQFQYTILHGADFDLRLLRVIGAKSFEDIEKHTKEFELKGLEGRLVGHSNNSNCYCVCNPATGRIMESRTVIFIEMPSRLLPSPPEKSRM